MLKGGGQGEEESEVGRARGNGGDVLPQLIKCSRTSTWHSYLYLYYLYFVEKEYPWCKPGNAIGVVSPMLVP
jgi:hypothetical protein